MAERAQTQVKPTVVPTPPTAGGTLQRKCACGTHTMGDQCDSCKGGAGLLQRKAAGGGGYSEVPPIVHDVLRSPGQPLDTSTRSFMESQFRHDFSHVRVHTNVKAAESARALNALAYTVDRNVVFGADSYTPGTKAGQKLLAHELAHVVQQNSNNGISRRSNLQIGERKSSYEIEADRAADAIAKGTPLRNISAGVSSVVQRAEVAGCKSDTMGVTKIGDEAHDTILGWCAAQNPPCTTKPIQGASSKGSGLVGYADLFFHETKSKSNTVEIGEIKPKTQAGLPKIYDQLFGYYAHSKQNNPGLNVELMKWEPKTPPSGVTPFLRPKQYLFCVKPQGMDGMYFYWCEEKKQEKKERKKIPAVDVQKILEALKKLRERYRDEIGKKPIKQIEPEKQPAWEPGFNWDWVINILMALVMVVLVILAIIFAPVVALVLAILALIITVIPLPGSERLNPTPLIGAKSPIEGANQTEELGVGSDPPVSSLVATAQRLANAGPETAHLSPENAQKVINAGAALTSVLQTIDGDDALASEVREAASGVAKDFGSASGKANGTRG